MIRQGNVTKTIAVTIHTQCTVDILSLRNSAKPPVVNEMNSVIQGHRRFTIGIKHIASQLVNANNGQITEVIVSQLQQNTG